MQPTPQQTRPQPQRGPTLWEMAEPSIRNLRHVPRDMWQVGIVQGTRDIRAFLAHPPRWFVITASVLAFLTVLFCAISLRNYFTYYAH